MPARNEDFKESHEIGMTVNLWYARPKHLPAQATAEDWKNILTAEERARSRAFRFEKHRREYIVTRLLVRNALSHYHPAPPQTWNFRTNRYGKPSVDPDCGLRFNLSNSSELVVCLMGDEVEVGVDIEPHDRAMEVAKLAREIFSSLELEQIETLSEQEKFNRALSLWTLKESYIKARGLGLSLPLKSFSFVFGQSDRFHLELDPGLADDPANWRFRLLNLAEHRVAVAVRSDLDPHVNIWEARPPLYVPVRQRGVTEAAVQFLN